VYGSGLIFHGSDFLLSLEKAKADLASDWIRKRPNFTGFSAKIGTSVKGIFDIEVNYFRDQINQYKEDRTLLSDDATANYFDVLLTWWLLRSKASDFH
jgi:hypothetical protein